MTLSRKILGQSNPVATVLTDLYTVPGSTSVITSSIVVCNRSSDPTSFRVSVSVNGAIDDPSQYIYYDVDIPGNETFIATIGMTLAEGDVVRVYANDSTLSFTLFGIEVSQ